MVPRLGNQHLKPPHATEAENCNLYSGELRPLNRPALAHKFCEPGDTCFITPKPEDPSIPPEPPPEPPQCVSVVIVTQPTAGDLSLVEGGTPLTLSVIVNSDATVPVQYQWLQDNQALPGEVGPVFDTVLQPSDSFTSFTVFVQNPCGEEISLPVVVGEVFGQDLCKVYECDAYDNAIIATGPEVFYRGFQADDIPPVQDFSGNNRTGVFNLGTYSDPTGPNWIDPCSVDNVTGYTGGGGSTTKLQWSTNTRDLQAISLDGTWGIAIKTNYGLGVASFTNILGMRTDKLGGGSAFTADMGYDIRWHPDTGQFGFGYKWQGADDPDEDINISTPAIPEAVGFDGNGDAKWILFLIRVQRTNSSVSLSIWADGVFVFNDTWFNTRGDTGILISAMPWWNPGQLTEYFRPTWGASVSYGWSGMPMSSAFHFIGGSISDDTAMAMKNSWDRNKSSYVDPNPNCRPPT